MIGREVAPQMGLHVFFGEGGAETWGVVEVVNGDVCDIRDEAGKLHQGYRLFQRKPDTGRYCYPQRYMGMPVFRSTVTVKGKDMKYLMPAKPKWLKAMGTGRPVGVDRKNNVLRGYVVAQLGPFKSEVRGEFDLPALQEIVRLGNASPAGLKMRFTHPDMSSDGLGNFLGRAKDLSMGQARDARTGKTVAAVRADGFMDQTAMQTPPKGGKPLGQYVLDLAESDPEALSSSLVLNADENYRINKDGTAETDKNGDPLPPLWWPTRLHASDIVDTGDAVDGLLSANLSYEGLPLSQLWQGAKMLDEVFAGQPRDVVETRVKEYLTRYLDRKYGPVEELVDMIVNEPQQDLPAKTPKLDQRRAALADLAAYALAHPKKG